MLVQVLRPGVSIGLLQQLELDLFHFMQPLMQQTEMEMQVEIKSSPMFIQLKKISLLEFSRI
jgi:hypothetical protein